MARVRILLVILVLCTGPFSLPHSALADEIVLAADPWCPYNCVPKSSRPGILVEFARQAFAAHGHTVTYINMPWAQAIRLVRTGVIDGLIGAGLQEIPDFIFPDREILQAEHIFYVKMDDNWEFAGLDSLSKRKLGVLNGYAYGDFLSKYSNPEFRDDVDLTILSGYSPLRRLVQILVKGRVDTIIEDRLVFSNVAKNLNEAKDIKPAGTYAREKIFIAFSPARKKSQLYADILSNFIEHSGAKAISVIEKRYLE